MLLSIQIKRWFYHQIFLYLVFYCVLNDLVMFLSYQSFFDLLNFPCFIILQELVFQLLYLYLLHLYFFLQGLAFQYLYLSHPWFILQELAFQYLYLFLLHPSFTLQELFFLVLWYFFHQVQHIKVVFNEQVITVAVIITMQ